MNEVKAYTILNLLEGDIIIFKKIEIKGAIKENIELKIHKILNNHTIEFMDNNGNIYIGKRFDYKLDNADLKYYLFSYYYDRNSGKYEYI